MKHTLRALIISLALLVVPTLSVAPALAVDVFQPCANTAPQTEPDVCTDAATQGASQSTNNPVIKILKLVINIISIVVGLAAVIILIVSGLRMVLASGDAKGFEEARGGIINALVGLAVVAVAQSIVVFILNKIK